MILYLQMAMIMLSMINGNLSKNPLIMMISVNYDFNSFGVRWVIIFRNVGSSHKFCVFSSSPHFGSGVRRVIEGF